MSERRKHIVEFLERFYRDEIIKAVSRGERSLVISFKDIDRKIPEIADELLENPNETIKEFEEALKEIDVVTYDMHVRFTALPNTAKVRIRDIRAQHIGKLIAIEGIIRQASDVRPVARIATFECPSCGTLVEVPQSEFKLKEPFVCPGCGRKGKFKLVSKVLVDTQRIVVEENPELIETQPRRISVFLSDDLVDPKFEKRVTPGNKVIIYGIPREIPLSGKENVNRFDIIIDANYIESVQQEFEEIEITPEDEILIKELASSPDIYEKLVKSIAPSIFGYERIKEAIVLQMFGGVKTTRPDGTIVRGDIHILLVGDPGVAKSQLLKYVARTAPKARYVSGKGTTGAGLTAAVVKDEFLKGFSLEAGALVLANKGIACIDEIDKMDKEDRVAMHEAMEQQTVTIAKANIHATLKAETTILAAANPKLGRFDPYVPIADQINLPPTLISRFDLIFTIRDVPQKERDEALASHILGTFLEPEGVKPEIAPELLKKYIAYAKQHCQPKFTKEAYDEIKNFFVNLRNKRSVSEEEGIRPIPISARQLEALVRLAQASARIRLSDYVERKDAQRAISLMKFCLEQVGLDVETGEFDIDRIVTGITASQRSKIITVREIIRELEERLGKSIPIEEIMKEAKERGIEEAKVEEIIEKLKKEGEIFEPRHGIIRRLGR